MRIRDEIAADFEAVQSLHLAAFEGDGESRLVKALHSRARPLVSLVAEQDGAVIGHILFSPVTLDAAPSLQLMGLAPMAVLPEQQRRGVGAALVEGGLECCREIGVGALVVLGHPNYYPKFGFTPSASFGIKSQYDVPVEAFMLLELQAGYLNDHSGTVRYHDAFNEL